jgi:hypothetical protein
MSEPVKVEDLMPGGWAAGAKGKVGVSGTLTFRDKDGNVVKTMELNGSVPLQGAEDGTDNR